MSRIWGQTKLRCNHLFLFLGRNEPNLLPQPPCCVWCNKLVLTFGISINRAEFVTFVMPVLDIVMPTQYNYSSHIRSVEQIYPLGHKLTKTQQPPNVSTLQLTSLSTPNSQVHQLTNSRTQSSHQLINPSTCQLKAPSPYKSINSQAQPPINLPTQKLFNPSIHKT